MAKKLSSDEKLKIVLALKKGQSQHAVAKESGRSIATVNSIAQNEGIPAKSNVQTQNATIARTVFAKEERLKLSDELFTKIRRLLRKCKEPSDLRNIAVSFAIAVEKRVLEEGSPTTREEVLAKAGDPVGDLRALLKRGVKVGNDGDG